MTDICILGYCPATKQFGVAAASSAIGGSGARLAACAWRGIVYSQGAAALPSPRRAAQLLEAGWRGKALLDAVGTDPDEAARRLVLTIDAQGRVADSVGAEIQKASYVRRSAGAIAASSGHASAAAVAALLEHFDGHAAEPLAERLMRCIEQGSEACQAEFHSAFLRVHDPAIEYAYTDVTVDCHQAPVSELRKAHDWLSPLYAYYALRGQDPTIARYPQWLAKQGIARSN